MNNESSPRRVPATVVIPCHNAAPYIRVAIESCINQTRPAEEIVVIDDASTDGSTEVLMAFAKRGAIRLIRNEKCLGKATSLNRIFDTIQSKYVILQDADDESLPQRFERQVAFMDKNPSLGCSSSFVYYINKHGVVIGRGVLDLLSDADLDRYLSGSEPFGLFCPATILRSEVLGDPSLRFRHFWPGEDLDLWNRIAEAGWKVVVQPEFLVRYRIHSTSVVTSRTRQTRYQYEWMRACLRARRAGLPELSREEFDKHLANLPWHEKANRFRKTEAKTKLRSAAFAYAEGNIGKAVTLSLLAAALQPGYTFRRLWKRFLPLV